MTDNPPPIPPDQAAPDPPSRLRRFFKNPLSPLAVFIAVSLILKENYPLSHYPMYSGIVKKTHYFYVADGDDNPIPTRENFGKSASAIKKMYGAHLGDIAKAKDTRPYKLGWDEQVEAGSDLLDHLRERGEQRSFWKRNRPEKIRLIRVDISRDGSGIVREKRLVVEAPSVP